MSESTIQKNKDFISSIYKNSQYQDFTFNSSFEKQNKFMKQSLKTTTSKFKMTTLTDEKINEANHMRKQEMKTFVILKFSLLNKTQIEKFNHFSANSVAVDVLNEKKFAFKNSLKSSEIINFTKQSSKTTTSKFKTTTLTEKKQMKRIICMI